MGQLVSGYLDFCRTSGRTRTGYDNEDWAEHLDRILTMSGEQLYKETEVYRTSRLLIKQWMNIKNIKREH